MISTRPIRTFGVLSVALLAMAATPAIERVPGYTYDTVTKTSTNKPNAPAGAAFGMTTRSIVTSAGASRMDVISVEGTSVVYAVGDYMIMKDGKMWLVHPATKTYVDLLEQAQGMMANLPPQLLSQLVITDVTGKSETIGKETIEGQETEHRRVTIGYSMGMMGQSIPSTIVTEYWLAKLPVQIVNPLAPPKTEATAGPMIELVKKQIELTPKITEGIPMKFVMSTTASMMGQSMGTSITTEVKNLKPGNVDASLIALPTDYTKVAK